MGLFKPLDDLHISESEMRDMILANKLNFQNIRLYKNPVDVTGNEGAGVATHSFTVPPNECWILVAACVRNDTTTSYARLYTGDFSTEVNRPNVGVGYWASCMASLLVPLVLFSGETVTLNDQNCGGGATMYYTYRYYKLNMDEIL
jgi:hypothetical protein